MCVVDRDRDSLTNYKRLAEQQGLRLRLFDSVASLRDEVALDQVSVVILDLEADRTQVIPFQRELLQVDVPPALILTTNDRQSDAVFESFGLGAITVLTKPWNPNLLSHHLHYALIDYRERYFLDRELKSFRSILDKLTDRQCKTLELAITGAPNKVIAKKIGVSQRTVETERAKLLIAMDSNCYMKAMIRLGNYQILERAERLQKLVTKRRLGLGQYFGEAEALPSSCLEATETPDYVVHAAENETVGMPKTISQESGIPKSDSRPTATCPTTSQAATPTTTTPNAAGAQ